MKLYSPNEIQMFEKNYYDMKSTDTLNVFNELNQDELDELISSINTLREFLNEEQRIPFTPIEFIDIDSLTPIKFKEIFDEAVEISFGVLLLARTRRA